MGPIPLMIRDTVEGLIIPNYCFIDYNIVKAISFAGCQRSTVLKGP